MGNAKCLLAWTAEHITAAKEKMAPRAHEEKPLPPAKSLQNAPLTKLIDTVPAGRESTPL